MPVPPVLSIVALPGEIAKEQAEGGSVGDFLSQLTNVADNTPTSNAQPTNLKDIVHLRRR